MNTVLPASEKMFVPIRFGTVLHLFRTEILQASLKKMSTVYSKETGSELMAATYSSYELGNRLASEETVLKLIHQTARTIGVFHNVAKEVIHLYVACGELTLEADDAKWQALKKALENLRNYTTACHDMLYKANVLTPECYDYVVQAFYGNALVVLSDLKKQFQEWENGVMSNGELGQKERLEKLESKATDRKALDEMINVCQAMLSFSIKERIKQNSQLLCDGNVNLDLLEKMGHDYLNDPTVFEKMREQGFELTAEHTATLLKDYEPGKNMAPGVGALIKDTSEALEKTFFSFYYNELFYIKLAEFFPIRHIGAQILANILVEDTGSLVKTPPYPSEYYVPETSKESFLVDKPLFLWMALENSSFRSVFAEWLLHENRFINIRFAGPNQSIAAAEKLFAAKKAKDYMSYTNRLRFATEAINEGLFFEFIGPAIDVIMAFSENISLSPDLREITVTFRTLSGEIREVKADNLLHE